MELHGLLSNWRREIVEGERRRGALKNPCLQQDQLFLLLMKKAILSGFFLVNAQFVCLMQAYVSFLEHISWDISLLPTNWYYASVSFRGYLLIGNWNVVQGMTRSPAGENAVLSISLEFFLGHGSGSQVVIPEITVRCV